MFIFLATCGGTVMVRENVTTHITSPSFPYPFATPVQCQWNVKSPNTHMIEAKVDHVWLFYNPNCTMEQLMIRDGNSTANPLIGPVCVPRHAPDVFTRSASNQITVQFTSNSTTTVRFKFIFRFLARYFKKTVTRTFSVLTGPNKFILLRNGEKNVFSEICRNKVQ